MPIAESATGYNLQDFHRITMLYLIVGYEITIVD